jgi:hypothetical protein
MQTFFLRLTVTPDDEPDDEAGIGLLDAGRVANALEHSTARDALETALHASISLELLDPLPAIRVAACVQDGVLQDVVVTDARDGPLEYELTVWDHDEPGDDVDPEIDCPVCNREEDRHRHE